MPRAGSMKHSTGDLARLPVGGDHRGTAGSWHRAFSALRRSRFDPDRPRCRDWSDLYPVAGGLSFRSSTGRKNSGGGSPLLARERCHTRLAHPRPRT